MSLQTNGLTRLIPLFTAAALVAGCGSAGTADTTAEPVTTTTAVTETTVETPDTTVPLPEFPEQRTDLVHGAPTWAVVLAGAANPEDPAILTAEQAATDAGYNTGWTDCDEGAAEALGMQAGIITLSVYFETEEDAEMAAEAFAARGVDGVVAEVRTFCLD